MARPAIFVVKATIAREQEAAFNEWYDTVRAGEIARVPGCLGMTRYAALPLESGPLEGGTLGGFPPSPPHAGAEPWQYMVCYEFDSEASLQAFVRSDTLRAMTKDYDARFRGERARFAYRQIFP